MRDKDLPPPDLEELWKKAEGGSRVALELMFWHPKHKDRWLTALMKRLQNVRSDDKRKLIAEQVLEKLYSRWTEKLPRRLESVEGLMVRSLQNQLVSSHFRSPSSRVVSFESTALTQTSDVPYRSLLDGFDPRMKRLKRFVRGRVSPLQYKHFLLWCMFGKVPHAVAARIFGKSEDNMKVQWQAVKRALREYMKAKNISKRKPS